MAKARFWWERAQREKGAIGAFNAASIETLKAIVTAAENLKSPVMIEASQGEVGYFGARELVGVCRAMEQSHGVPILLNLDHAPDFESCKSAIDLGFDYVHLDGSKLDIADNVRQTRQLVEYAHKKEVLVEGEIDNINVLGGASADNRTKAINSVRSPEYYTNPDKAFEFVQVTAAIGIGIQKVNVNSELRIAFFEKLKEVMQRPSESEVAIYKIMPEAILAMQKIVEEKIKVFG